MSEMIHIQRDASLRGRNTFGVAATAPWLVEIADTTLLRAALRIAPLDSGIALVLGGGSNLLFAGNPEGTVLCLTGRRVTLLSSADDRVIVRADAGVEWHGFVMRTLDMGLSGLENLALIPGTVGAAPIQNIGAYGVEVRESIHAVEALEPATGKLHRFAAGDCGFAYRDSVFKQQPYRYIVTAVEFRLSRTPRLRLEYSGLAEELAGAGITEPTAVDVANAVIAIRQRKLPDPSVLGNAGSFFKNPIVPAELAEDLLATHPSLPVFRGTDADTRKLSAAWLIDSEGWKGFREGDAGVADSHALVLVNHGEATGQQLLDLARRIADSVQLRYGVALEPEPRIIGARW